MGDRALISCKLVWDSMSEFQDVFDRNGVEAVIPDIPGQQLNEEELIAILPEFDGILAGDDILSRKVIEACPRLKVISKWGIGVDAIDHSAAADRGVKVFNTPGVFGDELGDYALGFLLLMSRHQHTVDHSVHRGEWKKIRGTTLAGKTAGVLGLGSSGRAFARRVSALGMTVIGYDPVSPPADWLGEHQLELCSVDEVFRRSDVVSLHLPATPETRHIVNSERLALMEIGSWLINISRGALVDEPALVSAIESGRIAQAALDVFENEPLSSDHPFTRMENVILGSHNGSNTHEAVARTNRVAIDNLLRGLGKGI